MVPKSLATTFPVVLSQIYLRRRMRLPLLPSARRCEGCQGRIDVLGDQRAARPVAGRLRRQAKPMELVCSAVFGEAGPVLEDQVLLRDTNFTVHSVNHANRTWWHGAKGVSRAPSAATPLLCPHGTEIRHRNLPPRDVDGASFVRAGRTRRQPTWGWERQNQYGGVRNWGHVPSYGTYNDIKFHRDEDAENRAPIAASTSPGVP